MTTQAFHRLLDAAFRQDGPLYLTPDELSAYKALEQASPPERPFRFERVRLVVAMSLMKALADLGDHDESRQVLQVLHRALEARNTDQIDAIITKEAHLFERLYTDLYVNEDGVQLLHLFERTLDADSIPAMNQVIADAGELIEELDFDAAPDQDDEDE